MISADRRLDECCEPLLGVSTQLIQRILGRPHGAVIEGRLVAEAERRVPHLELLAGLEVADDVAVLGISGHAVPGSRRELRRGRFDDWVDPRGPRPGARSPLSDLCKYVGLAVPPACRR